jgi:hypothetical protein
MNHIPAHRSDSEILRPVQVLSLTDPMFPPEQRRRAEVELARLHTIGKEMVCFVWADVIALMAYESGTVGPREQDVIAAYHGAIEHGHVMTERSCAWSL